MDSHLDVARTAARAGASVIERYFREGVTMRSKESYNLVSDADLESEQAIVRVISEALPDHQILGEEEQTAALDAEHLWVVDPLDGTNNFGSPDTALRRLDRVLLQGPARLWSHR